MTKRTTLRIIFTDEDAGTKRYLKLTPQCRRYINRATAAAPTPAARVWKTAARTEHGTLYLDKAGAAEISEDLLAYAGTVSFLRGNPVILLVYHIHKLAGVAI